MQKKFCIISDKLLGKMGFPVNWKDITKYKLTGHLS